MISKYLPVSSRRLTIVAAVAMLGPSTSFYAAQPQKIDPAPARAAASADRAQIEEVLSGLNRGRSIAQVAISPDGKRIAWIEHTGGGTEIRVAALSDQDVLAKSERVTAASKPEAHCDEGQIAWAPDATALAFFSDCARQEQPDLYLARMDGSPAQRLTELKGYVDSPAFSPDGSRVAFLYVEGATRPAGALAATKPPAGVIGEDGMEIERVAVARVDASKPEPVEMVTPSNLHVYEFDWRPDSKALAYIAADPPGENNWWVARLYAQVLGWKPEVLFAPAQEKGALYGLQIAVPRWSPDGTYIAFIGGLMSDQGSTGGDVWIIEAQENREPPMPFARAVTASWLEWKDATSLYVSSLAGGNARLELLDLRPKPKAKGAVIGFMPPVYDLPATVGDGRLEMEISANNGHTKFVFAASSFDRPPEIYLASANGKTASALSDLKQLTRINDGVEPAWGKTVSLDWKNGKFNVQGWLMLPKEYDPAMKYPLIVIVHGGPAAAATSRWEHGSLSAAAFSALGYFVLLPNPRGSFGQGEEFTEANRKDFGYGDLSDILAGVDTVEAKYPVDEKRVGLTGWSYGGFMTMFAVTQTQRFKAAVAGAGISDWQSYYGENSIDQWMMPYFGASVYDDPPVYAKSSAIDFIRTARTPTLVLVGDRDGECPAPQSFEFWHALKDRQVPTQLVVYPNEGHGFVDPAHRRDVMVRAAEWFARYMPPAQ
ncbi:MAG: S9 family peptidase [Terracidiphilus sp.]|jgi:dipeptidyl aminopeptidase/acylaminoacyl peptidase